MTSKRAPLLALAGVVGLLVFAGTGAPHGSAGALVKTAFNKKIGAVILVDARGHTLYLFKGDTDGSSCTNDPAYHCSKVWPPLRTSGPPVAGKGVNPRLLGKINRSDGIVQVTYKHHPLYTLIGSRTLHFKADVRPGDANGQGEVDIWYVVSPAGNAITKRVR